MNAAPLHKTNCLRNKPLSQLIFILLCLIWGSSFILMKLGMYTATGAALLNAWQVAALRMLSAGLVLLPVAVQTLRQIPRSKLGYIVTSGLLGSFFPAFLFCIAETRIDSALAGTINALTPVFTMLVAIVIFRQKLPANKITGIVIGFAGCILLFLSKRHENPGNLAYAGFVVLATICYGLNVNLVQQKLLDVGSVRIAAVAFTALIIPAAVILVLSGYFKLPLHKPELLRATGASCLLGILGTALASVIFYVLVKKAGIVFASLVTYGIPFVAIGWGYYFGESIGLFQVLALLVILAGVYLANLNMTSMIKRWRNRS